MLKTGCFWFFLIMMVVSVSSCSKEQVIDNSISAEDHSNLMSATDATITDATGAAGQVKGLAGKTQGSNFELMCGVLSADTGTGHSVTITYDNTTACKGMTRGGSISVSIISGPFWKDAYAQLRVVFNDLTFTNLATGAAYNINGTYTVTNETGGLAWRIVAGLDQNTSVTHRVQSSNMSITFPNGTTKLWNIDRTISYSSVAAGGNNVITLTASSENKDNEDSWGTDRNDQAFQSYLITPLMSNNAPGCNGRPYQGEYSQQVGGKSVDILYGVDDNGNPVNSPSTCAYGYKVTYNSGKKILTKIVAYNF